jgi:dCTP diphosphatase
MAETEKTFNDFQRIRTYLREFAAQRDWDKFHSPKNLVMALSVETAELMEHFQWLTEDESKNLTEEKQAEVADEIADIQLYLIRLADKLNIEINEALLSKTKKNETKYPAELVRGSAKKYSEYPTY